MAVVRQPEGCCGVGALNARRKLAAIVGTGGQDRNRLQSEDNLGERHGSRCLSDKEAQ